MVSFSAPNNSGGQWCLSVHRITVVIKGVLVVCLFVGQINVRFEHQGKKVSFGEVVYNVKKTLFHRSVLPSPRPSTGLKLSSKCMELAMSK